MSSAWHPTVPKPTRQLGYALVFFVSSLPSSFAPGKYHQPGHCVCLVIFVGVGNCKPRFAVLFLWHFWPEQEESCKEPFLANSVLFLPAVCCLDRFYDHYTTLKEFGDYISDATMPLQSAINNQGACTRLDSPPSNYTNRLLNTTHDFVNGSFARMVRSYSRLDPTVSRGYQDILLFLALEDVQNLAAVRTELVSPTGLGDRFRFFVGMAHIRTLQSTRLAVSSSQVEINADITTSYVYTTKTSTDFTFIRDVSVQLREVRRAGTLANSTTTKFATITIIVPETVTAADAVTIIPPLSLQVGVGYLANLVTTKVYPCETTYTGATKNTIDTLLADQSYCALQDPICSAQGPVAVGPGGSIQFTFPLEDTAWSAADLAEDARLRRSLFY